MTWKTSKEQAEAREDAQVEDVLAAFASTVPEPWKIAPIVADVSALIQSRCAELKLHPQVAPAVVGIYVAAVLIAALQAWVMRCRWRVWTRMGERWTEQEEKVAIEMAEAWTKDLRRETRRPLKKLRAKLFRDHLQREEQAGA